MNVIDEMVEITLPEENFLKVKETLMRIGIASKKENKLFQSCHILHKRGKYYIVHFKELFILDGKTTEFSEEDKARRNTIVNLLEQWNLLQVVDPSQVENPVAPVSYIKVLAHKDKSDWELVAKYTIGKRN